MDRHMIISQLWGILYFFNFQRTISHTQRHIYEKHRQKTVKGNRGWDQKQCETERKVKRSLFLASYHRKMLFSLFFSFSSKLSSPKLRKSKSHKANPFFFHFLAKLPPTIHLLPFSAEQQQTNSPVPIFSAQILSENTLKVTKIGHISAHTA